MVTVEALAKYVEENDWMVEVEYGESYVYCYIDSEDRLTNNTQNAVIQFRTVLSGVYTDENGEWDVSYFDLKNDDWRDDLESLAEKVNSYVEG